MLKKSGLRAGPCRSSVITILTIVGYIAEAETFSSISNGRVIIQDYLLPTKSIDSHESSAGHTVPFALRTALADGVLIKPSKGRGLGVFAALPIPSGAWFGEYRGELMTSVEVENRYWEYRDPSVEDKQWLESRKRRNQTITGEYIFDIGDDLYIDGEDIEKSSWCRYLNHASAEDDEKYGTNRCNAESRDIPQAWNGDTMTPPRMFFVALRDIAVGEEICFDYGEYYWDGYEEMII
jgi:hypothetical protein